MISKFLNIFKIADLRTKLLFTAGMVLIYRLGGVIPIPGVRTKIMSAYMESQGNTILGLYDMFAGGLFSQASIFALGIMPYISASIIIQLLGAVVPYFQRLQKEGEAGRKKITQLTRYGTVLLASFQGFGVAVYLTSINGDIVAGKDTLLYSPDIGFMFYFTTILTLVTGTIFVMWLGEQITDNGIGNGISLIIMMGILARAPRMFYQEIENLGESSNLFIFLFLIILIVLVTIVVVTVTTGVRKIPVQYAKRVVGRKVYGGQSTHIPLRILTAGVMPIIFAQAIMFLPGLLARFFDDKSATYDFLTTAFEPGAIVYSGVLAFFIIIFTYFYTAIAFNPVDVADNMKKNGGFIPGVRPGKATAEYIDHILTRVTLPASIFLALIAIFPSFLMRIGNAVLDYEISFGLASFYGGTSLLIIVGVALDTLQQIESHLVMRHYDGFLKTGKIKGRSRS